MGVSVMDHNYDLNSSDPCMLCFDKTPVFSNFARKLAGLLTVCIKLQ